MPQPTRKLGKLPRKRDPLTLRLANYVAALPVEQPKPPLSRKWSRPVKRWPMLLNDQLGDCTIASTLHLRQSWNANCGRILEVTDAQAEEAYKRICGYVPGQPDTDQGGIMLDVLKAWRKDGIADQKIGAFLTVNRRDRDDVKRAINWFGGIYSGFDLPESADGASIWRVVKGPKALTEPGGWGGHAVAILDYSASYLWCASWDILLKMSWDFYDAYCDESYAVITEDFLDAKKQTPDGLDIAMLTKDLQIVTR